MNRKENLIDPQCVAQLHHEKRKKISFPFQMSVLSNVMRCYHTPYFNAVIDNKTVVL